MNSIKKKIISLWVFAFVVTSVLSAQEVKIKISKEFPRLILSKSDIAQMKKNVNSNKEPWKSTWNNFQCELANYLSPQWKPKVYTGNDVSKFYPFAINSASAARDLAIGYHISGNRAYAEKSINILEAWLAPDTLPASYFDPEIDYPNMGMKVARSIFSFLYAYDLLMADNLISSKTQQRFEQWMRICEKHIKEGEKRWKENDYFDKQYYNNHLAGGAMGLLGIGIILNDNELAQFALSSIENERDVLNLIEGLILMEGQTPYYREIRKLPVQTGEIMDRYRHYEMGGHYADYVTKPNRGLQYAGLSTVLLMVSAEMAINNGVDLYKWKAPTGESIKLPLDFYADFYITKDASIKGGFYAGEDRWININNSTTHAIWEVAFRRYPREKKFAEVLKTNNRGSQELHILGPVTLTHGRGVK